MGQNYSDIGVRVLLFKLVNTSTNFIPCMYYLIKQS